MYTKSIHNFVCTNKIDPVTDNYQCNETNKISYFEKEISN